MDLLIRSRAVNLRGDSVILSDESDERLSDVLNGCIWKDQHFLPHNPRCKVLYPASMSIATHKMKTPGASRTPDALFDANNSDVQA